MKTIPYYIATLLILLTLHGCVPSPMYELTSDELQSTVTLTFDWQRTTPQAPRPHQLLLRFYPADGTPGFTRPASATGFEGQLPPGNYRVLAFQNTEQQMFIADSTDYATACVNLQPCSPETGIEVPPAAWYFGASADQLLVKSEESSAHTLPVTQHVVPLNIYLEGTGLQYIRSLNGTLTGVATCVDLASGKTRSNHTDDCYSRFTFSPERKASFLLLGTAPDSPQQLSLSLIYTDGSSQTLPYDMTTALNNVNQRKFEPVELQCTVNIRQQPGGFDAGIVKWEIIDMGEIEPTSNH